MKGDLDDWPLILRGGFGNLFSVGRWDQLGIELLAIALESGREGDWELVVTWSNEIGWDPAAAN